MKLEQAQKIVTTSRGGVSRTEIPQFDVIEYYVYISSYYGMRWGRMHTGIDLASPQGTNIYSWKDGVVTFVGWSGGYGNFIIVDHGDGTVSRYGHCSGFNVSYGQAVQKGEVIGFVGSTGNSTGAHLHFEILVNGEFVDPLTLL